jgi:hypothetical protein
MLMEQGEEPSFLRRARVAHDAWDGLLKRCQSHRNETLRGPRLHLGNLSRLTSGNWSQLGAYLADESQVSVFATLYDEWKPLMAAVNKSTSPWSTIRSSLVEFVSSVHRFNGAWDKFLVSVDLDEINRLRTDFNQYYPIEKAAAFDSEAMDRLGFTPLDPATIEHLRTRFPALEVPALV